MEGRHVGLDFYDLLIEAIEFWDSQYYHAKVHDQRDDDSLRAREKRREEIFDEILGILGADPRAFRLSFRKVN